MGNVIIAMSFLTKYSVSVDVKNHTIHFPDISLQLKQKHTGKFKCSMVELRATQRVVLNPFQQVLVNVDTDRDLADSTGIVEATEAFQRKSAMWVSPSISQLTNKQTAVQVTNPNNHTYTINPGTVVAFFKILTPTKQLMWCQCRTNT